MPQKLSVIDFGLVCYFLPAVGMIVGAGTGDSNAQFPTSEEEQLDGYVVMNLNTRRAIEIAYSNGLLPQETFETIESEAIDMLQSWPGLRPIMQSAADYSSNQDDRYATQALRRALATQD